MFRTIKTRSFFLCTIVLFLGIQTAAACSCAGMETACSAYSSADAVFIGTVTKTIGLQAGWNPNRSYVRVEKVYKGSVPREAIFSWGTTSCDVPMQAGEKWLLYASKMSGSHTEWYIGGCGRSRRLKPGVEDINYLESSHKGKPVGRLSGSLRYPSGIPLANVDVEIMGNGESRKLTTDDFGTFEIYGLDPGPYTVGPAVTDNWWGFSSSDGKVPFGPHMFNRMTDRLSVELRENSCVETSFTLESQNYIKGVVATEDGSPITGVCVKASFVGQVGSPEIEDCVNEDGVFLFSGVPSGKYILWAESKTLNRPWRPDRFPPVYFPNSFYRAASSRVTVTDDDSPEIRIVVPRNHPVRLLKGNVIYSDGSPAAYESVVFSFRDGPENRSIETRTDKTGAFTISITTGIRGRLNGEGVIWKYETEECAKLRKYASKDDFTLRSVGSNSVPINGDEKTRLVLKLPYSKCPETN